MFKVKPFRRVSQFLILAVLTAVPYSSQNPSEWSPSRIIQGQMPPPSTCNIFGDTWNFEVNGLQFSHPLSLLDAWLSTHIIYIPLLVAAIIPLALTILLGRVFCSWLCPVGFLLELIMTAKRFLETIGIGWNIQIRDYRYFILASCIFVTFVFAFPALSVIDPPHTLGRELMNMFTHHQASFIGATLLLVLLIMDTMVSSRACCSKLCPSGGGLSLLGSFRLLRIRLDKDRCIECGRCDEICPYELEPMRLSSDRSFNWTKCDNCGLCRDSCPEGAIEYAYSPPTKQHN